MFVGRSDNMFDLCLMDTISDIARAFGTQKDMADALGLSHARVERWCQRNSSPSKWLIHVVEVAQQHDIELTTDRLAQIIAYNNQDAAA